ncbi:MAG: hypothetical protein LBH24_05950 [Clostridiales bacterium]|jgi:hypothetical protein|nr:hypothetical protein [Clostridiales bacterium]
MQENEKKKGRLKLLPAVLTVAVCGLILLLVFKPWERIGNIDEMDSIDLTSMSSNMVYVYVNDMVNNRPEDYVGKTIKAKGNYQQSVSGEPERARRYLVIQDAAACCAQGVEFVYENEYPEENREIELTGIFERYEERGETYYRLSVIDLIVL